MDAANTAKIETIPAADRKLVTSMTRSPTSRPTTGSR